MDRITRQEVENRVTSLNQRMEIAGSKYRYQVQSRNGYVGLDRFTRTTAAAAYSPRSVPGRGVGWDMDNNVMCGTKREVATYLNAMIVALHDAAAQNL